MKKDRKTDLILVRTGEGRRGHCQVSLDQHMRGRVEC